MINILTTGPDKHTNTHQASSSLDPPTSSAGGACQKQQQQQQGSVCLRDGSFPERLIERVQTAQLHTKLF